MLVMVLSQFVTTPLSMLVNAVLARRLGAEDFGTIYLVSTMVSLGFLFVDWGQSATIATEVAKDRKSAEQALGVGLVFKLLASIMVSAVLAMICWFLGYQSSVFVALGLIILQTLFGSFSANYQSVLRGIERFDEVSRNTIASNLLAAAFVIPVALLGGKLRGTLAAQTIAALVSLVVIIPFVTRSGVGRPRFSRPMVKKLIQTGTGFLIFNLVLALQPNVDAVVLSKMAPAEVVGWFAAARRLIGVLIFPVTTLCFALYPTLVRLWRDDKEAYRQLVINSLRAVIIFGVCIALGTALFADVGIRVVYGGDAFAPAVLDLQFLAGFILLLFLSLVPGCAVVASGLQMPWAGVQAMCIVVSAVGDPLLVPYFQRRYGNGGIGICATLAISEALMLASALVMLRSLKLAKPLLSTLLSSLAGAIAMIGCAILLPDKPSLIRMSVSVAAYFGVLFGLGGFDRTHLSLIVEIVRERISRRGQPAAP